jgi:hypothetical protein
MATRNGLHYGDYMAAKPRPHVLPVAVTPLRELPNEVLAQIIRQCCCGSTCFECPVEQLCNGTFRTTDDWFDWLESEAEE